MHLDLSGFVCGYAWLGLNVPHFGASAMQWSELSCEVPSRKTPAQDRTCVCARVCVCVGSNPQKRPRLFLLIFVLGATPGPFGANLTRAVVWRRMQGSRAQDFDSNLRGLSNSRSNIQGTTGPLINPGFRQATMKTIEA